MDLSLRKQATDYSDDLPDELVGQETSANEAKEARLAGISAAIVKMRQDAVTYRENSGVESVWLEAEDAYIGIDDANRSEFSKAKWAKPMAINGPLQRESSGNDGTRSTVYVRLTSRYVDAGAAKLSEILIPVDDKSFSISPTPIPEVTSNIENDSPAVDLSMNPIMGENGQQAKMSDIAASIQKKAEESAKLAEKRIYDWMVESGYQGECRKVIFDAARIGVGILKGPVPTQSKSTSVKEKNGAVAMEFVSEIKPGYKWVDPWNFYPMQDCGERVQDSGCFERDYISEEELKELKAIPGYIVSSIDAVILEGPGKINDDSKNPNNKSRDKSGLYEIWYYYGKLNKDDLLCANPAIDNLDDEEHSAQITMVNDTVIKAVLNPMESGKHPYHNMPWQRRPGNWAGVGICEQVRAPQRMCNAATRAMLNNAGVSSGVQLVVDRGSITPADGTWSIYSNKIWYKSADTVIDDVRKAFVAVEFPNQQGSLMNIIEYAFRLAEESTNIPLISQGQSGKTTPDTFGAAQLQNNNANQLLRSIGYQFDDFITAPVVNQSYEWLLNDASVPSEEKGDFKINAHGSSSLVERAIQDQFLMQMGAMVVNPAFEISPARWFAMLLKSKRLDPRDIQLTDAEKKQMSQAQAPAAPQVQAAQIRAATEEKIAASELELEKYLGELDAETSRMRIKSEMDRDTVFVQSQANRDAATFEQRIRELEVRRELAIMNYANQHNINVENVKAKLADSAMRLRTQRELSAQVARPAVEPAGRAPNGQAFAK